MASDFTLYNNSPIKDYVHLDDHAAIILYLLIMKLDSLLCLNLSQFHNILFPGQKKIKNYNIQVLTSLT